MNNTSSSWDVEVPRHQDPHTFALWLFALILLLTCVIALGLVYRPNPDMARIMWECSQESGYTLEYCREMLR